MEVVGGERESMEQSHNLGDHLGEKCGVFGVAGAGEEAARLVYYGLWALQHRGQESSGIASSNGQRLNWHNGNGLVSQAHDEATLAELNGPLAIGHNRYSTSGRSAGAHSQPIVLPEIQLAFAHNGNLPSTKALEAFLTKHKIDWEGLNDSEMMAQAISWYLGRGKSLEAAVAASYPLFTGAFSALAMTPGTLVAFRDRHGIRPLALGRLNDGYVVSSETCAFDLIGAAYLREIKPGELVSITSGEITSRQLVPGQLRLDIFEFVYFARPDSFILRRNVNEVRRRLGRNLAAEIKVPADVVIPVPDSAIPAALGYAEASGIPFDHGLIKNRYVHRTFIRPAQQLRERDVQMKFNPLAEVLMGKSVAVLDDSIVRGTTTKRLVAMLYGAGAREVHVLISSPPVKYPDFYGIDTPKQADLIAARLSTDEIRHHIGADSLHFLSFEGMVEATKHPASYFSTACFTGDYPIDIAERAREVLRVPEQSPMPLYFEPSL